MSGSGERGGPDRTRRWRDAVNMLCIRLDGMGDVLMTTPAMRALKQMPRPAAGSPGRRLTLLASKSGAEIARYIPEVDAVLRYEAPWMKASAHADEVDRDFVTRLRDARFDAAVIFTCYSQSPLPAALLCTYAGIPLKLAHCRENPYALLSDWVREIEPQGGVRHEVQRHLDLVATVGAVPRSTGLSLGVDGADHEAVTLKLERRGMRRPVRSREYVVVHTGATAPSRRYAPERFAAAARQVSRELDVTIVFTGDHAERERVETAVAAAGVDALNVAGELTLGELVALIRGAGMLVSNNSGPVHIAAAVGTPVVDLYALTNPQHTPWMVPHRVLNRDVPCRYCYQSVCPNGDGACLDVPVEEVVAAAKAVWHSNVATAARVRPVACQVLG